MAAEDESATTPSLEPPRLFRRRRATADPVAPSARAPEVIPAPEVAPDPTLHPTTHPTPPPAPAAPAPPAASTAPTPAVAAEPSSASFADTGTDVVVDDQHPPVGVEHDDLAAPVDGKRAGRRLPAGLGAAAAGLLSGVSLLVLMWAGFRGCELARGNESCGTGPGMIFLVVIFTLTVLVGRGLLGLLKVPEPGITSFLAVGLTCLVAVVVLSGLFDSVAILVVVPLLSAAAFCASAWVATLQLDSSD